jgi:hypothetical protein
LLPLQQAAQTDREDRAYAKAAMLPQAPEAGWRGIDWAGLIFAGACAGHVSGVAQSRDVDCPGRSDPCQTIASHVGEARTAAG